MLAFTYKPSIREMNAGESGVSVQPHIYREFKSSQELHQTFLNTLDTTSKFGFSCEVAITVIAMAASCGGPL